MASGKIRIGGRFLLFWCWPRAKETGAAIVWTIIPGLSWIEMDGFDLPLIEKGMYSAGTLRGSNFRTARIAPSPHARAKAVARRVQEIGRPESDPSGLKTTLNLRDIRVAIWHARRRRPAGEMLSVSPRIERRRHRHRHVRSVVVRQSCGVAEAV